LAVPCAEQFEKCIRRPAVLASLPSARRAFEKVRSRHLEDSADLLQSAGPDAVRALLVFLNLLERQSDVAAEDLLGYVDLDPPHPDAAADVNIDRIRARAQRLIGLSGSTGRHRAPIGKLHFAIRQLFHEARPRRAMIRAIEEIFHFMRIVR
jgi:hypothetical protein